MLAGTPQVVAVGTLTLTALIKESGCDLKEHHFKQGRLKDIGELFREAKRPKSVVERAQAEIIAGLKAELETERGIKQRAQESSEYWRRGAEYTIQVNANLLLTNDFLEEQVRILRKRPATTSQTNVTKMKTRDQGETRPDA
ncbi:hypothetical protein ES689_12140 [Frigoribacterium sp. ACAM 257]|uniref:hypothetical protein n=1 Tax=Frigoribacterium sp. ACAM 257 TaxID=2508998 RepID=UPI0011B9BA83|nr:hypothetical protein [Frigoribacterium sp. ACAM 257]TWX37384.1 hypothetical protein ES689_12140 [Frigoribacterium sp. ACAM 257]